MRGGAEVLGEGGCAVFTVLSPPNLCSLGVRALGTQAAGIVGGQLAKSLWEEPAGR